MIHRSSALATSNGEGSLALRFVEIQNIRVMENKMETTIVYWGYMGMMEKKMETTVWKPPP